MEEGRCQSTTVPAGKGSDNYGGFTVFHNCKQRNGGINQMKSKRILIVAVILVAIVLAAILLMTQLLREKSFDLKESGSLYENIFDFALDSSGEPDELTQSFLESVQYEIIDIDKENMTATVDISVPVITDELSNILDNVIAENNGKDYEDLKQIAESELSSILTSNQLENEKSTLTLQIEEINGSYKLVPSEEWNKVLTENLENLYMSYLESLIGGMTDEMP